jgi:hypothetical protein
MKKILLASISLALTMGFYACKKSSDVAGANPQSSGIIAAKVSGIKSGEPIAFTLKTSSNTSSNVSWKVLPSVGVLKAIAGKKATFKFTIAGKYTIIGSDGFYSDSTQVSVDSIPYTGGDTTQYAPKDSSFYPPYVPPTDTTTYHGGYSDTTVPVLYNDQINITPSLIDTAGISSGVLFSAKTSLVYPSSAASLVSSISYDSTASNGFGINYQGVLLPANTTNTGITSVASTANFLFMWQDGKYTLHIIAKNKTYIGSVNKVGNTYTITWPYSSGVLISPLVLKR